MSVLAKLLIKQAFCQKTFCLTLLIFLGCLFLSSIIPPLKSPDEHDHIERAYLLGKGVIHLDQLENKSSGGFVDSGLLKYIYSYLPSQETLSAEEISAASAIRWSGHRVYDPSPGTGYYFPLIYLPQALGLMTGELLDLTIDNSYKLARALALFTVTLLLYSAFRLYPTNPLVLALIVVPMTLFQIASASLDGVSTALAIFVISAFLRIAKNQNLTPLSIQYSLGLAIALLASSRVHALPMLLLLGSTYFYTRNKWSLLIFIAATLFIFGWTLFVLKTTIDLRVPIGESTSNIILFYLLDPFRFFSIIWQTLSDHDVQNFYYKSFFGILGWLDAPLPDGQYRYFLFAIILIALLSANWNGLKNDWSQKLLLFIVSLLSILFIFFSLLVTWSPHPAKVVSGIQGRYFLIPLIIFAYCISGYQGLFSNLRTKTASFLVAGLYLFSIFSIVDVVINRYYLTEFKVQIEKMTLGFNSSLNPPQMIASKPLSHDHSINLHFPPLDHKEGTKINRIGILFGTHSKKNPGDAKLLLLTRGGEIYSQKIVLPDLVNNGYEYFTVPANDYDSGQIIFDSGGGVSVWQVHSDDGQILSCLKLRTVQNQLISISGCP